MDRRSFLTSALLANITKWATAAPSATPAVRPIWQGFDLGTDEGSYVLFIHPDQSRDLRELEARDAWREHYRQMRIAGRRDEALSEWQTREFYAGTQWTPAQLERLK
jgi:hypothetical protein